MNGDLIGVNTAILSGSGTSSGVGFAIPAALVKQVVTTALGGGHVVVRPWLGVKAAGADRRDGQEPRPRRAAGRAGRRRLAGRPGRPRRRSARGDVIVSVNGQRGERSLRAQLRRRHPGAGRHGDARGAQGRRRARAPSSARAGDAARHPGQGPAHARRPQSVERRDGDQPVAGRGRPISASTRSPATGVVVTGVAGGYAAKLGLQPGDFIRQVNGAEHHQRRPARRGARGRRRRLDDRHPARRPGDHGAGEGRSSSSCSPAAFLGTLPP